MTFEEFLQSKKILLTEGSVIERLRRDPAADLDPHILHAGYPYVPSKRERLAAIYREYLDISERLDLAMIVCTPTWRANPERAGFAGARSAEEINQESVRFLKAIRSEYGAASRKIFLGGLIGCRGDAYNPKDSLPAAQAAAFHQEQVRTLAGSQVDFLIAATLPALSEARGIARAMAIHKIPYILSFIIRSIGTLLDGTTLSEAVSRIDAETDPPPACYWMNCVHPSVFAEAMEHEKEKQGNLESRVIGLQANTSPLPPEDLENSPVLKGEDPASFAASMMQVHERFGTRVLGGCCGTSKEHIQSMAVRIHGKAHG